MMGQKTKEGRKLWLRTLLSGVAGAILSSVILWLAVICQIRTQYKQSYDLNVAGMVTDVLLAKDVSIHPLLIDLLRRVEDDSLRTALGERVLINPTVSPDLKDTIETILNIPITERVGIIDSFSAFLTHSDGGDPFYPHIEIIFLRGDSLSQNQAKQIFYAFEKNRQQFPYEPKVSAIGGKWFYRDKWAPESNIPEIRYNNSNTDFAERTKALLDNIPELGEFQMNRTNIGTPPYAVLIILPDQTQ
jgi:hypothetical protein